MKQLITYFIRYEISGNVLLLMLLIFGAIGMYSLKSTFFPQVPSQIININATYPGSSPEEMEEGVVQKIENTLKGVTGIEKITSISSENRGSITVEITTDADIDLVLQDVKNNVDGISSFPVGLEKIDVTKREQIGLAISFAISGDIGLPALKERAREAEQDLLEIDGISKIELTGFPDEEVEIRVSEDKMRAYGLTIAQVSAAVRNANIEATGGTIIGEKEEILIRANEKEYYAKGLKDIIIKGSADGQIVRLYQVAELTDQWVDNPNRSFFNGKQAVVIKVNNTNQEDILKITETVREYIDDFNEKYDDVEANIVRDRSIVLNERIDLLSDNGIIGFILVLILLAMFLHYSLAFWVALAIPVSFGGMFILATFFGITINVISLFGMIVVIGILVDDGIVISENIYQHYEKGKSRFKAAIDGTMEVLPAVTSAILTTIVAFSVFFFIDGRLGDFFGEMAFIVIATLIFSLIEGMLILPAHVAHSRALKGRGKSNWLSDQFNNMMHWMRSKLYAPLLKAALTYKTAAILVPLGILILTFGAIGGGIIKATFFPNIESDNIAVTVRMPAGTRGPLIDQGVQQIENAAWEVNEELKAERADGKDVILNIERTIAGANRFEGKLNIILLNSEARGMEARDISSRIREKTGAVPGAEQVSYGVSSPFGSPVSISLLSDNEKELLEVVDEVKHALGELSGLKDIGDNNQEGLSEVSLSLKEGKSELLGLTLRDVVNQVRQGFFGDEVMRVQRGEDEVRLWVRYTPEDRLSIGKLENMRVRLANGSEFPLTEVADFEIKKGVIAINHLNGYREITVTADIANSGVSVSDITSNLKNTVVPEILSRHSGVRALFEGQNREQEKSSKSMGRVLMVILPLMLAIVILTFRSLTQAIIVFLLLPFGFVGVGWGHFIHDKPISLFSIMGIIALIGILINDALVFVASFNQNLKEGKDYNTALIEAGLSRFRPIVLTSITTVAGLAPLIVNDSFQAQFLIPMAISVAYGLIFGTVIILVVLPALLMVSNRLRRFFYWSWHGKAAVPAQLEPAVREMKGQNEMGQELNGSGQKEKEAHHE